MRNSAVKLLLPLLTLFAGFYLLWSGTAQIVNTIRSHWWNEARGEVVSSKVVASRSNQASNSRNTHTYRAEVQYAYDVNGKRYYCRTIAWRDQSSGAESAERLAAQYATGTKVTVYYDPETPTNAVLDRGFPFSSTLRLFFGALFAAAGVLLIRFMRRLT